MDRSIGKSASASAFTLIELLVVVAIVSVLASVLLPALSASRREGARAVCLSNMRALGCAVALYAGDNDDQFPASLHWGFDFSRGTPWGYALFAYVTGERWTPALARREWVTVLNRQFHCPLDRVETRIEQLLDQWSYGINVYLGPAVDELRAQRRSWERITRIPRPAATVSFAEIPAPRGAGGRADHVMAHFWTEYGAPTEGSVDENRHRPRAAYLFTDGHCVPLDFRDTFERVELINDWNPATAW